MLQKQFVIFRNLRSAWYQHRTLCQRVINGNHPPPQTTGQRPPISKLPALNIAVSDLPKPIFASITDDEQITHLTTLSNGIRVASEKRFGEFCTVGAVIDAGSRYEAAYPNGVSHFLEKLAFHSTKLYRDRDAILSALEKHGGICDSQSSRDTFIYAASAYISGLDDVIKMLADVVLRPQISDKEVSLAKQAIEFELESLKMKPEQDVLITDMIHAAAFRENTLGLRKVCPVENLSKINRKLLLTYLSQYYSPERIVVAGVGVDHDKLVESVQKYFVDEKPIWHSMEDLCKPNLEQSIAQYTGGYVEESCDIPPFASADLPILAHVMIALESVSHQHDLFVPLCVLNTMLGGGGSFSAGGPGKGMYSRLYTNVLNRCHWMYSATAYNHSYMDTGVFVIHASTPPKFLKETVDIIIKELFNMTESITDSELQRSKTQLKSMLLMNLESRPVVFEDIGRQVLATGYRKRPEQFIKAIDDVTKDHIVNVAKKLLSSLPSVAARGDLKRMPDLKSIQKQLFNYHSGRMNYNKTMYIYRNRLFNFLDKRNLFKPKSRTYYTIKRTEPNVESLSDQLVAKIKATGPMTVEQYMKEVLTHPVAGYYTQKRDILSAKSGDFITSPELSQLFGEIVGVWLLTEWRRIYGKTPLQIIELGPGRGTLMYDILQVFKHFKQLDNLSVHLVEISQSLSFLQGQKLCKDIIEIKDSNQKNYMRGETIDNVPVYWYRSMEDVPSEFSLIIANEFFDVLPIHKFRKTKSGWREILIDYDETNNKFRYIISRNETPASKLFTKTTDLGDHKEVSPEALFIMDHLAKRLKSDGGVGLIVDYGYFDENSCQDSFRAYKQHKQTDPLINPGSSDLTADVNFKTLKEIAEKDDTLTTLGPICQRDFLINNGILERVKMLEKALNDNSKDSQNEDKIKIQNYLSFCREMLLSDEQMGHRFKVLALYPFVLNDFLSKSPTLGFSEY